MDKKQQFDPEKESGRIIIGANEYKVDDVYRIDPQGKYGGEVFIRGHFEGEFIIPSDARRFIAIRLWRGILDGYLSIPTDNGSEEEDRPKDLLDILNYDWMSETDYERAVLGLPKRGRLRLRMAETERRDKAFFGATDNDY